MATDRTTPGATLPTAARLAHFDPGAGIVSGAASPDLDDIDWLQVAIPGDVHRTLIDAGEIPDPFWDQQERDCAWMEDREWWYRVPLDVPSGDTLTETERWELVFHGLDTFATIYLDGEEIGASANMFHDTVLDITDRVAPGGTYTLALCFHPPLLVTKGRPLGEWGANPERTVMRKAQFGYGWDWGPRLPTIGAWRPIELRRVHQATLLGVHFATVDLTPARDQAIVSARVEAERVAGDAPLRARATLAEPGTGRSWTIDIDLSESPAGHADGRAYLTIEQPTLWWTHDFGEPALQELAVELRAGDDVVARDNRQVGVRTLQLDQSVDTAEPGTRFFRFVLNGVPIFAKGADWIPADSFVGAIEDARYERWLTAARDANMNMLRVWGGGIYEHDVFYDLCDRMGILVWQDFMFACAAYPEDNSSFVHEVDLEARYQVRRLRSHPSLAVWVGNNENQWLNDGKHWNVPFDQRPPYGELYYNEILPDAVAELDGRTPYWPGSPYGGNDYNSMEEGNRHNWDAWHGQSPRRFGERGTQVITPEMVSYRRYAEDLTRFCSEFGLHASPAIGTLRRAVPEGELYHHSPAMDWHNKDNPKNKGDMLMESVTGVPETLEDYIDFSQIAQAEGLKFGIEHFRRRKPHCSGTLVWQMNDCWPVLSWSVMDYYGAGKAGYFYLKRVYSPVLASFTEGSPLQGTFLPRVGGSQEGAGVSGKGAATGAELWITNDTLDRIEDEVTVTLGTFVGETIETWNLVLDLPANASQRVLVFEPDVAGANRYLRVTSGSGRFPANRHFFRDFKDLDRNPAVPAVAMEQASDSEVAVTLTAPPDGYCWFVHLERECPATRYSDNYVDLAPGETTTITVRDETAPVMPGEITIGWR